MRYLSDEWFAALDDAARAVRIDRPADAPRVVVQTVVTADGDTPEVAYHLVLEGSTVAVRRGRADQPTATFTQDRRTAEDVASGRRRAQEAFMAGDVQVTGDVNALIEHRDALAVFDDVTRAVAGHPTEAGAEPRA